MRVAVRAIGDNAATSPPAASRGRIWYVLDIDSLRYRQSLSDLRKAAAALAKNPADIADLNPWEAFELGAHLSLIADYWAFQRVDTPSLAWIEYAVPAEGRWPEKGPLMAAALGVVRATSPDAAGRVLAEDLPALLPSRLVVPAWLVREHRAGVLWVLDTLLEALRKVVLAIRLAVGLIGRTKPLVLLIVAVCLHYGHRGETGDGSRSVQRQPWPGCFARS